MKFMKVKITDNQIIINPSPGMTDNDGDTSVVIIKNNNICILEQIENAKRKADEKGILWECEIEQ